MIDLLDNPKFVESKMYEYDLDTMLYLINLKWW